MPNLFDSPSMAAGYASARPAVHPHIILRIREHLQLAGPVGRALDIGCGAGLSTRPLQSIARRCYGIDPAEAMLRWSKTVAPGAIFIAGKAESLCVRSHSMDIITAAGSLNYADLDLFFPEAKRVLAPGGVLIIYDFSEGRRFRGSDGLEVWYSEFLRRYPAPPDSAREISPASLQSGHFGLRLSSYEFFSRGLRLDSASYVDYVMTETNVAHALTKSVPEQEIRAWCNDTLAPVFNGEEREVLFEGYIAYMVRS